MHAYHGTTLLPTRRRLDLLGADMLMLDAQTLTPTCGRWTRSG